MVSGQRAAGRSGIFWVLAGKCFMDVAKSPGLLACAAFPVVFLGLCRFFITDSFEGDMSSMFTLTMGMLFATGMVPGTTTIYPMAEAREKRTLRTLMLAGVDRGALIAARGIASLFYTILVAIGCFVVSGAPTDVFAPFMLATLPASIALTALGLLLGLASRNQMAASFFSLPIILIGIAPMLCMYSETAFSALPLLPSGGGFALVYALSSDMLFEPALVPSIVAQLTWAVAAVVALALVAPRIPDDA